MTSTFHTMDLLFWKQPLYQLSHNHCPVILNFLTFKYLEDKKIVSIEL